MKRWLKWIGIGLAIVIVVIVLFATWLLEAESGARFALERVKAALANKLSVENARGALASPLVLEGLHYRDVQSGIDNNTARDVDPCDGHRYRMRRSADIDPSHRPRELRRGFDLPRKHRFWSGKLRLARKFGGHRDLEQGR